MFRIGTGYDAHRLVEGRKLVLCGVEVPHERGLLGHSDADVATHALIDALLGAAALGDIGKLFPDTDPQYKGADSIKLLEAVVALLLSKGWRVNNADITIVCEKPKLAPHIMSMRERLAATLTVPIDTVSVKATTVEGMGAIGRREGIAANAAVTVGQVF